MEGEGESLQVREELPPKGVDHLVADTGGHVKLGIGEKASQKGN